MTADYSSPAQPLPHGAAGDELVKIRQMLEAQRIAVVGLSDNPNRPSYRVAEYLKTRGRKDIIPVNPNHQSVLGLKCYSTLADVPGEIDLVDVFRRAEFCPKIVQQAIQKGVKGIWLQQGIRSPEARELARKAGINYVEDRCLMVEHMTAM